MKTLIRFVCSMILFAVLNAGLRAQQDTQRISRLESRVSQIERQVRKVSGAGVAVFLYGAFCALWAQNSGRNAWLWFFLGLFFSVITVLFLLSKNASDIQRRRMAARART